MKQIMQTSGGDGGGVDRASGWREEEEEEQAPAARARASPRRAIGSIDPHRLWPPRSYRLDTSPRHRRAPALLLVVHYWRQDCDPGDAL
jgi:hypothetical protein